MNSFNSFVEACVFIFPQYNNSCNTFPYQDKGLTLAHYLFNSSSYEAIVGDLIKSKKDVSYLKDKYESEGLSLMEYGILYYMVTEHMPPAYSKYTAEVAELKSITSLHCHLSSKIKETLKAVNLGYPEDKLTDQITRGVLNNSLSSMELLPVNKYYESTFKKSNGSPKLRVIDSWLESEEVTNYLAMHLKALSSDKDILDSISPESRAILNTNLNVKDLLQEGGILDRLISILGELKAFQEQQKIQLNPSIYKISDTTNRMW